MKGDEARVEAAFAAWLEREGWDVKLQVDHLDVLARKEAHELRAEVKGDTGANCALDADTAYGQLLRRMVADPNVSYAVVGPPRAVPALLRVPAFVRQGLRIDVYEVRDDGSVVRHASTAEPGWPT